MIKVVSDFSMFAPKTVLTGIDGNTFASTFARLHRFVMSDGKVSPETGLYWDIGGNMAYQMAHNAFYTTGNDRASTAQTSTMAVRLYGITHPDRFPQNGIYQVGVRLKREGAIPTASPVSYRLTGNSTIKPTASTSSAEVYVEVVVDWTAKKLTVFYDGVEAWSNSPSDPLEDFMEILIGSSYDSTNPAPFMVGFNTKLIFSDFYFANYSTKPAAGYPVFGSVNVVSVGLTSSTSGLQTALNTTYSADTTQAPTGYPIESSGVDLNHGDFGAASGDVVAVTCALSASKTASSPASSLKITINESGVEKASVIGPALLNPESTFPVRGQPMAVYCKEDGSPMTGIDLSTISVNLTPTKPRA